MKKLAQTIFWFLALVLAACSDARLPEVKQPTKTIDTRAPAGLDQVDFAQIPPLDKSRFQEGETATGEPNPVAEILVANGKQSIPFLIEKLTDETQMDRHIKSFWYQLYVADLAFVILTDLFTDISETKSTIPGFSYDDFLGRGKNRDITGEELLRSYIRKHGRDTIKRRWTEMWENNKEKIYWSSDCYCFELVP